MEFHAIVLCGPGKQMTPFSQVRSTGTPKALLPIANRPMVDYALEWCENAFFARVTVVCSLEAYEQVKSLLDSFNTRKTTNGQLELDVYEYDGDELAGVLAAMARDNRITHNHFVVVPCDFVTNLPPQVLIEAYRNRATSDFGMVVFHKNLLDIEDKKRTIFPRIYTIHSELAQPQLLDLYTQKDVDFHKLVPIRTQMTWRYPRLAVLISLLLLALFFGSRDILDVLANEPRFDEQYCRSHLILKLYRDFGRRSWKHAEPRDTLLMFVVPDQATFIRSTNPTVWMEANRYFMKLQATEKGKLGITPSKEKGAANIGIDSYVGEETHIGERTNVKRLAIGSLCLVGARVKLTGCVVLDHVTIEDDVSLENCIIGNNVLVKLKLKLVLCYVELTHEVPRGTVAKNETLLLLLLEGIVDDAVIDSESDSEEGLSSEEESPDEADFDDDWDNDDGLFDY